MTQLSSSPNTNRKKILLLRPMQPAEMDLLQAHFDILPLYKFDDPEAALAEHKNDIVGILSFFNGLNITRRMLEGLPNVDIISHYGTGLDKVDLKAAQDLGVQVAHTPDIPSDDTADTALALILNVMRRFVEADMFVRVGKWNERNFPLSNSLQGKKVGIVGMGRIGQAIARRVHACDMDVVYHGPRPKKELSYPYFADLLQMAEQVDVLVLSCPYNEETKYLVQEKTLKALGPKGYLINIARGPVVHEQDLCVALSNGWIAGAGLDVFEQEPKVPDALLKMDNVVLFPHVGGATHETRSRMGQLVIANLLAHFEGRPLLTPYKFSTENNPSSVFEPHTHSRKS
jgi:hydroxypyruvate reductase